MSYPKIYEDIIQGTEEWFDLRKGMLTGSVFKTFLVNGKSENGFGTGAITELYRIVEERLTGVPRENYSNKAMGWGHEYEQEARHHYELNNFVRVKQVGFIKKSEWIGCSPDGLIGEDEGLEIKCFPTKHIEIADKKEYGKDEYIQCQVNLWISNRAAWNLCYYHPNFPESTKMISFRIDPDYELFKILDDRSKVFIEMIKEKIDKLK